MYYCAQDILEYLLNSVGGGAQDSEHRLLRSAVHHAYRDVINARDWNWHVTTATLSNPDDNTPPGVGYTLPADVKNVDSIIPPLTSPSGTRYVTPTEWERVNVSLPQVNAPFFWTVVKHPAKGDRWMLKIAGAPNTATVFTYTYRRKPQPLRYMGYEDASRNGSLSTKPGLVKRYGTATNYPEGPSGVHPYTAEEIVGQAGSLVGTPPANAKTALSDYVDASDAMFTAILSCAEVWVAKMMGKNVEGALTVYNRDIRMAFEADQVAPVSGNRAGGIYVGTPRGLGYYSPSGPDTGA